MSEKMIDKALIDASLRGNDNNNDFDNIQSTKSGSVKADAPKGATKKKNKVEKRAEDKGTFEEKLARLEGIVEKVEGSNKPLEELIALFKEGMSLSKECKEELNKLEVEVLKILSENGDGTLLTENMDVK